MTAAMKRILSRGDLTDAIREAVTELCDTRDRFYSRDVVDRMIHDHPELFGSFANELARERIFELARRVMKTTRPETEDQQLSFEGVSMGLVVPSLIGVPADITKPLTGDCEWVPIKKATLPDLAANIAMLNASIENDSLKLRELRVFYGRLVSLVGDEHSTLTVAEIVRRYAPEPVACL